MDGHERSAGERKGRRGAPALEWIASAIGLVLTLAIVGVIGWKAWQGTGSDPPVVEVRAERIVPAGGGWVVEFVAINRSPTSAAAVQIEGTISRAGRELATSQATLDYLPGRSERGGGLFFDEDPRAQDLRIRALGYADP